MKNSITFAEIKLRPGVVENVEFLLKMRDLIKSYVYGKAKNLKVWVEYIEGEDKISKDLSEEMHAYLSGLTETINKSLNAIESKILLKKGHIKNLLNDSTSFLFIKIHLVIQSLLWLYIERKINKLPEQYENWNFNQVVDLAGAFNEIPLRLISFCYSLNELRNTVAHKPIAFEFSNIKRKYTAAIYKKDGVLFAIRQEPSSAEEIIEDWTTTFLVAAIVIGYLIYDHPVLTEHAGPSKAV